MRTYEQCEWLKLGTTTFCNKNCLNQFCKVHRSQIRKGYTPPRPCRRCGKGTNAETLLCRACGNASAQMRIVRIEKKARKLFPKVMEELLQHFR